MKKRFSFLLMNVAILCSCSPTISTNSSNSSLLSDDGDMSSSTSINTNTNTLYHDVEDNDFLSVFDSKSTLKVNLSFSNASLSALNMLQQNKGKYADAYFPADIMITLNDKTYSFPDAGVRMKGNTSRRNILNGNQITNTCHFKISLKATFDDDIYDDMNLSSFKHTWTTAEKKERKDRNFLGLEKFDLKYVPRNGSSILREIYAYNSFRKEGLMAPYATIAKGSVSNESSSLDATYEFIETIDKQFIKRRFPKANRGGDLYKCVYNSMGKADLSREGAVSKTYDANGYTIGSRVSKGKIGVEDNYNDYAPSYQLKTNDDNGEDSDFSSMSNYINEMWNILYKGKGKDTLENILEMRSFLSFSAISYLLGNFDDQRYNYNNYYLYFEPLTNKAYYLPYDWDWCLGLNAGNTQVDETTPFSTWTLDGNKPSNVYYCTFLKEDKDGYSPSYDRNEYQNEYLSDIQSSLSDVLNYSKYSSLVNDYGTGSEELESIKSYIDKKTRTVTNNL